MAQYYTRYPRTTLWLIRGGVLPPLEGSSAEEAVEVPSFYLSKFPITNVQLEAFDASYRRSPLSPTDDGPALGVSFEVATSYGAWYAELSRKPMRLPTVVEWEFACRGESTAARPWDDGEADDHLWHRGNSAATLGPLDGKKANGAGLFGMLGGAWEWTVETAASQGVLCGGSFRQSLDEISCLSRRRPRDAADLADVGFRLAKSLR